MGTDTTDTYRFAALNGVRVALPTANGGMSWQIDANRYVTGTAYSDAGALTNNTSSANFDELLTIWDAYDGTGTGVGKPGEPSG